MKPRHPMDSIAHTIATYSNVLLLLLFLLFVFFFFFPQEYTTMWEMILKPGRTRM